MHPREQMIKRLYVDNYKCFVNFEVGLDPLTLLLGRNGAGKTAILDIVFAIQALLRGTAKVTDAFVFPTETLTRWQSRDIQAFEIEVELGSDTYVYRMDVEHEKSRQRARIDERLTANGENLFLFTNGEVQLYRDDHSAGPSFGSDWTESALARVTERRDNRRLSRFLDFMRKVIICGLYPNKFEPESPTEDEMLRRDGRNFSGWYRYMHQEYPDLNDEYTEAMRDVIDGFHRLRVEKVGRDTKALMMAFREGGAPYELRMDEASDGQRALSALYALTCFATGNGYTLLIDEPENYVALAEIRPWLRTVEELCGTSLHQVVMCSHHPEYIDYIGIKSGVLMTRENSGPARAGKIAKEIRNGLSENTTLRLSELVADRALKNWSGCVAATS